MFQHNHHEGDSAGEEPLNPAEPDISRWRAAISRAVRESIEDALPDRAAALTYYSFLSIFPGLLVLVSVMGFLGDGAMRTVEDALAGVAPGEAGDILEGAFDQARAKSEAAGVVAVVSLLVAFWSASRYVAAFIRAANAIHDVPEGRPFVKKVALGLGLTAVVGLMLILSAAIVVFSGDLAMRLGDLVGLSPTAMAVWSIGKWPVLVVLVSLMIAVLYWASPNARRRGFRWVTAGSLTAVILWLLGSGGFALFVSTFGSHNRTYGALAGVVVFLVWLWLSNIAILLGAELDAELERSWP